MIGRRTDVFDPVRFYTEACRGYRSTNCNVLITRVFIAHGSNVGHLTFTAREYNKAICGVRKELSAHGNCFQKVTRYWNLNIPPRGHS
jgi:hypothetical protein